MYADSTLLIPDNVSYEQAAPIFCAGYTVWSGLRWADPMPHERVAVLGIGGLGRLAVQYAKAAGFETIAISHSPDKDKMIRELGADEIVRDGKSLAAAGGADIILSTSNSTKSMVDSIQGCARTAASSPWASTPNHSPSRSWICSCDAFA
jgi:alcohol dehydrogenase